MKYASLSEHVGTSRKLHRRLRGRAAVLCVEKSFTPRQLAGEKFTELSAALNR